MVKSFGECGAVGSAQNMVQRYRREGQPGHQSQSINNFDSEWASTWTESSEEEEKENLAPDPHKSVKLKTNFALYT